MRVEVALFRKRNNWDSCYRRGGREEISEL